MRNVDVLRCPNLASNLLMGFISLWIWFLHRSVCATIGIRGPLYFLRYGLAADCVNDVQMNSMKVLAFRDDPLPASVGRVFTPGVSGVTPSLGVNGFVLGVVVRVGYRPTGSSEARENPSQGTNPSTKTQQKLSFTNPTQ